MTLQRKKVVVRHLNGDLFRGYLPANGFLDGDRIEAIDPAGRTYSCALNEIHTIAYVREFYLEDPVDPERIGRRSFSNRPRGEGVWLRLTFTDGSQIEGLCRFDVALVDEMREDRGLFFTPPDARGNTQRLFVPRSAMLRLELLGAVLPPAPRMSRAKPASDAMQESLFER